jgi:hypothetical protein
MINEERTLISAKEATAIVAKVTAVGEAMIDDLLRGSRWS